MMKGRSPMSRRVAGGEVTAATRCCHLRSVLVMPLVVLALSIAEMPTCDAQGLLRRLGNRIRERIERRVDPAPAIRPVPVRPLRVVPRPVDPPAVEPRPLARPPVERRFYAPLPREGARAGQQPAPYLAPGRGAAVADGTGSAPAPRREPASSPSLGIEAVEHRGRSAGLRVVQFEAHSLADEAGLRPGDVIVAIDGVPTASAAAAGRQLQQQEIGERTQLRVLRSGTIRTFAVPLVPEREVAAASAPEPPLSPEPPPDPEPPLRPEPLVQPDAAAPESPGFASDAGEPLQIQPPEAELDDWTARPSADSPTADSSSRGSAPADLRRDDGRAPSTPAGEATLGARWEEVDGEHGARIRSLASGSPAEVAGLRAGDRIVSVQGRVVTDAETLRREIARRDPGEALVLQWVRDGNLYEAEVTLAGPDGSAPTPEPAESGAGSADPQSMMQGVGSLLGDFFSGGSASTDGSAKEPAPAGEAGAERAERAPGVGAPERREPDGAERLEERPADTGAPLPAPAPAAEETSGTPRRGGASESSAPAASESPIQPTSALQQLGEGDPPSLRQLAPQRTASPASGGASDQPGAREQETSLEPPPPGERLETVEQLRAEIERLKWRLQRLESRDAR